MATTLTKHERNLSAIIHASTFSKFIIPFGNFLVPLVLWTANKNEYAFVDHNGKQALNFQLSILLYSIVAAMIGIPFFIGFLPDIFNFSHFGFEGLHDLNSMNIHFDSDDFRFGRWMWPVGITGLVEVALFVINIVYTILATIRSNEGQWFNYPLTINFIK